MWASTTSMRRPRSRSPAAARPADQARLAYFGTIRRWTAGSRLATTRTSAPSPCNARTRASTNVPNAGCAGLGYRLEMTRTRTRSGRPHVVILDENLPVPLDRRVWLEAGALAAAGDRVTVISPRGSGDMGALVDRRDGIRILRYPQRPASGLAGYLVEYVPSMLFATVWLLALRLRGRV